ncbi:MAG: PAS domain-containing protein [Ignavibacteria bacterium]|nr:PAS domain-containing protein [Ignavibacteria bacterium]MCU7504759.1 PAS domain-containing protein [Ignavibacteria bacterium]MCU7516361.1 PAS domain-containing protein [Ignavibacteria bacterium]
MNNNKDFSILQQSEHKFRSIFETMFEGFILYEVIYDDNNQPYDYRYIELNNAAESLMGFPRKEMIGNTVRQLLPGVSQKWLGYYASAARGENLEFEEYSPALKKYLRTIMYSPIQGYVAALSIDLTARKKAEEALRLSEERLQYSLEAADEGYWDWDAKTNRVYFSPRYYTMLGYEPYEFEPSYNAWVNLIHPGQKSWVPEKATNESVIKDFISIEFQLRTKMGEYRWIESHWKVVERDKVGAPVRVVGTHSDITERKQIEEKLMNDQRRMNLILDTVPVAFYDIDLSDGLDVKWISKSIKRLTGYSQETFMKERGFWKSRIHKDDLDKLIDVSTFPGDLYHLEHRMKCADNKYKWFMYRAFIIRDASRKPLKVIGLMHDISRSKSYEEKLKTSEKQARELSRHLENVHEEERKNLAREVHDELGQALTVLKLMANSIKKDLLQGKIINPSDLDEMTGLISSTIKSVQRITTELRPDILDTVGLIAAIEWQAESFTRFSEIDCWLDLSEHKCSAFQSCIATIIFRTVQEALTNVSRHAGATRVNISLRKKGNWVILLIEDNGIGISPKRLKDMTSFGLKGMQERAIFAGGKLAIKGRKGKGTTVTLKIPLERAFAK